MTKINFSPQADEDLLEIWLYIAADNIDAADNLLIRIKKMCSLLSENPEIGKLQKNLSSSLRSFPHENYLVFYRINDVGIEVVRVLHSAREIKRLFSTFS